MAVEGSQSGGSHFDVNMSSDPNEASHLSSAPLRRADGMTFATPQAGMAKARAAILKPLICSG